MLAPPTPLSASAGVAPFSPRFARLRATSISAVAAADLLEQCGGSPERLAKLLTKDQLKDECARRQLQVSGTKGVLAPRLLVALERERSGDSTSSATAPPATTPPLPPTPPKPPPSAPPMNAGRAPPSRLQRQAPPLAHDSPVATDPWAATPMHNGARYDASGALIDSAPDASGGGASSGADLELTILGSGACNPSPWRGASCAALRVRDSYWLFDVGEGTQVQLQKSSVRPSKIDKIFITHAHGDHCFGLPGLLCLIARGRDAGAPPVQIYGPHGLRAFVRIALAFTGTRMLPPYVVHELHDIPLLRRGREAANARPLSTKPAEKSAGEWGEVGGTDIRPADDGTWWPLVEPSVGGGGRRGGRASRDDEPPALRVHAAPVHHTVPCVGYIISEESKPGRLLVEKVMPRLEANRDAIREEWGVRDPRALMKRVKELGPSDTMALPDGTELKGSEVIGEARRGRKVVILGDCCDASLCADLGRGADLLVHEATNAFLPQFGDVGTEVGVERETARHGHSTPQMAARLARRMGARALVLTHFSQRYHPANVGIMRAIANLASSEAGLPPGCVASAHDGLVLPIFQPDRDKPVLPPEALTA